MQLEIQVLAQLEQAQNMAGFNRRMGSTFVINIELI